MEKIEGVRNEMMRISRTYYSKEQHNGDSTLLKNYISDLKMLESKAKACPESKARIEVTVTLQRAVDSATVLLKRKFS